MSSRVSSRPALRATLSRMLTSLAAIAAVCVIFASKAAETDPEAAERLAEAVSIAR